MTAIKSQTRIFSRSPYYITCAPQGAATITSATLNVNIQTGSRNASVTSMTDLKTYSLSKSNAVDGVIIFDISPLVADYFDHDASAYSNTSLAYANTQQLVFVEVEKSVVDTSGTTDTTAYFVGIDGYAKFTDGVNYAPVTDATGNYGSPAWSPATAKRTERTIAATDCYRQISDSGYGICPIYMGKFDESSTDAVTFATVMFGEGESWKTYSLGNNSQKKNYSIVASDSRLSDVRQGMVYVPIGFNNMGANWKSGYDYLRVGHLIDREYTTSGKEKQSFTIFPSDCTSVSSGANLEINMLTVSGYTENLLDPTPGSDYIITITAFTDCTVSWPQTDVTASYQSYVSDLLTFSIPPSQQSLIDCFCSTGEDTSGSFSIEIIEDGNDVAIVNDNPVLRYEIICEPKYSTIDCFFINKWGAWDCFTFVKANRQRIDVQSSNYKKNIGYVSGSAWTYDTDENQVQRYNTNGRKSITVNTGFVNESFDLLLTEMVQSNRIGLLIDGVWTPVNIKTSSIEYKTSVNDKLMNYTLDFEFANDEIQTLT